MQPFFYLYRIINITNQKAGSNTSQGRFAMVGVPADF
jgi:hypothetical protein